MIHEKGTSVHTISRILLRELRQERNIQQAHISHLLGKASTSSWSKVESGDTPLTLEHLLTACTACQVWPSEFFKTVQDYTALLEQHGWFVAAHGSPLPKEEDHLSMAAANYYAATSNKAQSTWRHFSVLQTPWPFYGSCEPIDVFKWVLDPNWREVATFELPNRPRY
ncbi:helix-turn-helix domain-containing protein [Duganella sp. FT109W]|uniref:Helix-turn-helix domain-containing protein n=1 Tax=Duganella margarita TaxID=2692170 RepID=A0ABW9WFJ9_9BURK|nr:helix-turn-helix transcriptional regulator [Duganella margarita]MYN39175.1 helix-turn-helix domain-containing protein [Duganella margarita]